MLNMIATKPLTYATRRLKPGDDFIAQSRSDARVLITLGKAKRAEPTAAAPDFDIGYLRKAYREQHGKDADKRWGVTRLKRELGLGD